MLRAGASVNARLDNYDCTPLHYAAWHGKTEAAECLLSAGADVNAVNRDLKTPMHLAASNGHASTIRCLAQRGASLTAKNRDGLTPLDCAEQWGNPETGPALKEVLAGLFLQARGAEPGAWRVHSANGCAAPILTPLPPSASSSPCQTRTF